MELPAVMAAEQAMTQQKAALSMIKQSAQADQAMASLLEEAAKTVPASGRGANVNITA